MYPFGQDRGLPDHRVVPPLRLFGSELLRSVSHLTLMLFDKDSQVFYPELGEG